MNILGAESFIDSEPPALEVALTRYAWSLLQTFGNERIDKVESADRPPGLGTDEFETTATEHIQFGKDGEHSVVLDQIPSFNGLFCTDIGYVALHIDQEDEAGYIIADQQIVFRTEAHSEGPAVFVGDTVDVKRVEDDAELMSINDFLVNIALCAWEQYFEDLESKALTLPYSVTDKVFSEMIGDTLD